MIAYNTSKGAVVNFTRTLAGEWGQLRHHRQRARAGLLPEQDDEGHARAASAPTSWPQRAPLRRLGDDDDLKGAALLFASAAGKHITGQMLRGRRRRVGGAHGPDRSAAMKFPVHIPFVEPLGFELHPLRRRRGRDRASTLRDELCNSWSVAHGGVTMTLLDVVMAHAARSPRQPASTSAAASSRSR